MGDGLQGGEKGHLCQRPVHWLIEMRRRICVGARSIEMPQMKPVKMTASRISETCGLAEEQQGPSTYDETQIIPILLFPGRPVCSRIRALT